MPIPEEVFEDVAFMQGQTSSAPSLPRELRIASCGASGYSWWACRRAPSIGERGGAQLEMEGDRNGALAAFLQLY